MEANHEVSLAYAPGWFDGVAARTRRWSGSAGLLFEATVDTATRLSTLKYNL